MTERRRGLPSKAIASGLRESVWLGLSTLPCEDVWRGPPIDAGRVPLVMTPLELDKLSIRPLVEIGDLSAPCSGIGRGTKVFLRRLRLRLE